MIIALFRLEFLLITNFYKKDQQKTRPEICVIEVFSSSKLMKVHPHAHSSNTANIIYIARRKMKNGQYLFELASL